MSAANSKNSLLGEKVRQLISIAVAVTTRCDGCITFHTDAALKAGASKQEIAEALGVAMAMCLRGSQCLLSADPNAICKAAGPETQEGQDQFIRFANGCRCRTLVAQLELVPKSECSGI